MAKLLIVEHNRCQAEAMRAWLTREMHAVDMADNGLGGLEQLCLNKYDVCILNWRIPLLSAVEVCAQYRSTSGTTCILLLADSGDEMVRTQALEAGADCCAPESCSLRELSAYVNALMRRPKQFNNRIVRFGDYVFDIEAKFLTKNGEEIRLQPKECQILEFLLRNPNRYFNAETLLRRLWDSYSQVCEDTVRAHIKSLRRKLDEPGSPSVIITALGQGYKIALGSRVSENSYPRRGALPASRKRALRRRLRQDYEPGAECVETCASG